MTTYEFKIQIQTDGVWGNVLNLENEFGCTYRKFSNFALQGDIKNTYIESYAEKDGDKVWIPPESERAYGSYECTLELLFLESQCQVNVNRLDNAIRGKKIRYYDTFRKKKAYLVCTKRPVIQQEKIYGDDDNQYQLVSFTFTNIDGRLYSAPL